MEDFLRLLRLQGIRYGIAAQDFKGLKGLSYLTGDQGTYAAQKGDIIVPASQPRAVLTQVLFETEGNLVDSITYDITAWCLPMAYGLDAFATEVQLAYDPAVVSPTQKLSATERPHAYAM